MKGGMAEQPRPKSPPGLYGKRRQQAKLELLEREIGLLQKANPEGEKHRHLDREIREMVSAVTGRLGQLHKPSSSHPLGLGGEDEHGVSIITLAGTNTGATMRGDVLGRHHHGHKLEESPDDNDDELQGVVDTYVNSNCQAVNNSVMFGSNYSSNDPGVHMDIAEVVDPIHIRPGKHGRRGVRKGKGLAQPQGYPGSELSG